MHTNSPEHSRRIALFGGRFDPVHNGHLAVAQEVLKTHAADEVWFSLENQHQWRPIVASVEDRKAMLELAIKEFTGVIPAKVGIQNRHAELDSASQQTGSRIGVRDDSLRGKFGIDLTPVKLGGLTETISVMRELRKTINADIVFVVGSDQLSTFHKWTRWEDLQKEVQFLIIARKGYPLENVPANATVIDDPTYEPLEDSATRIRNYLKEGKPITGLVSKKVEEYIIEHGLYK